MSSQIPLLLNDYGTNKAPNRYGSVFSERAATDCSSIHTPIKGIYRSEQGKRNKDEFKNALNESKFKIDYRNNLYKNSNKNSSLTASAKKSSFGGESNYTIKSAVLNNGKARDIFPRK